MTERYAAVGEAEAVITVRRSKFIAYARRVTDEETLFSELHALRAAHKDATHVCYGAILDPDGQFPRFSDDGEPALTAGRPILDALSVGGYRQSLVAVVRYFGGVKLGTGGLKRAYQDAAEAVLNAAPPTEFRLMAVCEAVAEIPVFGRIRHQLERRFTLLSVEYGECVRLLAALPAGEPLEKALIDAFGGNVSVGEVKTEYISI